MTDESNFQELRGFEASSATAEEDLAAFDKLPGPLRTRLREAPVKIDATEWLAVLKRRSAQRGSQAAGLKATLAELDRFLRDVRAELRRELKAASRDRTGR